MYTLVVIRHGESEWNQKNLFCGWTDVDLVENGFAEARQAGRLLREGGYRLEACQPVDMFCYAGGVENVISMTLDETQD